MANYAFIISNIEFIKRLKFKITKNIPKIFLSCLNIKIILFHTTDIFTYLRIFIRNFITNSKKEEKSIIPS